MITRLGTYSQIKGSSIKTPCVVATTGAITLSGTQTIDGVAVVVGDRVLVKNQGTASTNGIYIVSASTWVRAVDMSLDDDVFTGLQVYVTSGTVNGGKFFALTTANPIVLGTSSLSFSISAAPATGGSYLPLAGGTLTGALNGTSAVFSSSVTAAGVISNGIFRASGEFYGNQYYTSSAATNEKAWLIQPTGDNVSFRIGTMSDALDNSMVQEAINITRSGTSISSVAFPNGSFNVTGAATFTNLAGTGTRMVVSNGSGVLSTQAIPTGGVTSVTGTSPIVSSGGTTPAISIPAATTSVNGYLTSTDWTTFNNKASTASLANYLPLAGGTLTGALNVTNANINLSNAYYLSGKLVAGTSITLLGMNASDKVSLDPNGYGVVLGGALTGTSADFGGLGNSSRRLQVRGAGNTSATYTAEFANLAGSTAFLIRDDLTSQFYGALTGTSATFGDLIKGTKVETLNAFTDYAQFSDNTNGLRISNYFDVGGVRWDFRRGTTSIISIPQSNNVGIGTTSPATKLSISNNGAYGIEIDVANENIQAYNRITSEYNEIKLYSSNLRFFNGTSSTIAERMRITSGGNVLIGTTTDNGSKLQVSGGATFGGIVDTANSFYSRTGEYLRSIPATVGAAQYQTWYNSASTRRAYFGFGSANDNGFALVNEATNGSVTISANGTGTVFLSSLSTTGAAFSALTVHSGGTIIPNGEYYRSYRTTGAASINLLGIEAGTDNTVMVASNFFKFRNTGTGDAANILTLDSTFVARFTGRVNVNGATDNSSYALNVSGVGNFSSFVDAAYYKAGGVPIVGYGGTAAQFAPNNYWQSIELWTNGVSRVNISSTGVTTFSAPYSSPITNYGSIPNVALVSTSAAAIGVGGNLSFVGQTGNSTAQYTFANIVGGKASVGGDNNYGGRLYFYTTNNSSIVSLKATLDEANGLTIGSTSGVGTGALYAGAATFSGTLGINGTADNVKSGTYTPTATFSNISSATVYPAQYIRVGNVVTVSGRINPIIITATTNTFIYLTLPVTSGFFTQAGQAAGSGMIQNNVTNDLDATISAVTSDFIVQFQFIPVGFGGTRDIYYQFTYLIT